MRATADGPVKEVWQWTDEVHDAAAADGVACCQPPEVALIAHDLRSPLNAIVLCATVLQQRWASGRTEDPTALFDGIFREAERMMRLIDDLLASSAGVAERHGPLEDAAPAMLVADAIEEMEPLARKRDVELRASCAGDLPGVRVDRARLSQVFANLIENALRFSPAGSTIALAAGEVEDGVAFRVADQGRGIPEDELPHVFEPFFRGRRARGSGAGLGLYIVRSIVEGHGGRIDVDSRPGAGTTFTFVLPHE